MKKSIFLFALIIFSFSTFAQDLTKKFDALLSEQFPSDGPGATALVAKEGKIIYHKAFGKANLELDVPMETKHVFEIGSVTKQFTAVSILMLMEEGKLSLDDEITKFIEDYPTHGHKITIHHLLTHTSGIKSYTSLEKWRDDWRKDFEPLELIDYFKNEPMDFAPGEAWLYNNSAYFILGYIIEKASGQSYENFIEEKIFKTIGMESSCYGSMKEITPKRASGYQKEDKFINAEYLSLTQPYAAGSIMSTVEDLFIWNEAIKNNKLVKEETIKLALTGCTLNDGKKEEYGYGWGFSKIEGSLTYEHSGGIFGYLSNAIYLPEEDVYVTVLSNCNCNSPIAVSTKMAAITIGKPYPEEKDKISLNKNIKEKWVGVYEFEDGTIRYITLENDDLYSSRVGGAKFKIFPFKEDQFFYDKSFAKISFKEDPETTSAIFEDRIIKVKGSRTSLEVPQKEEAVINPEIFKSYVGVYNLAPGFDIHITLEDDKLMSQATGQGKFQIFPESETKFFLKIVDAQIEFKANEEGEFDSFILYQGGQEIIAKKK